MNRTEGRWPELPWTEREPTTSTLHMWTQIVGRVRMALAPWRPAGDPALVDPLAGADDSTRDIMAATDGANCLEYVAVRWLPFRHISKWPMTTGHGS
jgi:hypothetical protein